MSNLIDINTYPIRELLPVLLKDKTTKKNIIWATDAYNEYGYGFDDKQEITADLLLGGTGFVLQPRTLKSIEEQQARTRKKAEVMTPVWLCNKMNNYADEQWFGRKDVFNHENEDNTWTVTEEKIDFGDKKWTAYVDSRRLEITCGEAPYLVSRYDTTTGELIVPPIRRIGMLDRKLRVVNENTDNETDWLKWAQRAIEASYGYEWQGDSLIIARINVLMTFVEYYTERWEKEPDIQTLKPIANIIAWNLWQMDGLKDTVPLGKPFEEYLQYSMFEEPEPEEDELGEALPCMIFDWRAKESLYFKDCKAR